MILGFGLIMKCFEVDEVKSRVKTRSRKMKRLGCAK
jgi:hypothetical protein